MRWSFPLTTCFKALELSHKQESFYLFYFILFSFFHCVLLGAVGGVGFEIWNYVRQRGG